MENIPVRIITKEEATNQGLRGRGMPFIIIATGKIEETKAEKIELHELKTGARHILFEKGKTNKNINLEKILKDANKIK